MCFFSMHYFEKKTLPKYGTFNDLFFNFWILYIVEMLPDKIFKKQITVPCLNRPTYFSPFLCWNSPWPCGTPCFQSPTNVSPFDHLNGKVHIFWEGHKILRNLRLTFDCMYCRQKQGEDFAKFCGLLRIYEL